MSLFVVFVVLKLRYSISYYLGTVQCTLMQTAEDTTQSGWPLYNLNFTIQAFILLKYSSLIQSQN